MTEEPILQTFVIEYTIGSEYSWTATETMVVEAVSKEEIYVTASDVFEKRKTATREFQKIHSVLFEKYVVGQKNSQKFHDEISKHRELGMLAHGKFSIPLHGYDLAPLLNRPLDGFDDIDEDSIYTLEEWMTMMKKGSRIR